MIVQLEKELEVPFSKDKGLTFYVDDTDIVLENEHGSLIGCHAEFSFKLTYEKRCGEIVITAVVKNESTRDKSVERLGMRLGIDTYMESYPEWNEKLFPTMLRCESTHLWGYFMTPLRKVVGIVIPTPVASWHLEYNRVGNDFGHRIYTACLDFFCSGKLPVRHPRQSELKAGKVYTFEVHLIPMNDINLCKAELAKKGQVPIIGSDKYTCEKGEQIKFQVFCSEPYSYRLTSPEGEEVSVEEPLCRSGQYTLTVQSSSGWISQAIFYCRESWSFYLRAARKECLAKPQKATTHCESWYGFFSGFLAAKHYPNPELDSQVTGLFEEILPLLFDPDTGIPRVLPVRIQNSATMVSVLVDKYETNPEKNLQDLKLASKIGDYLVECQTEDGVYRRIQQHYTCVIYIAKSMMELAMAEKKCGIAYLMEKAQIHMESAGRAIENLVEELDCIGTEGEHTLEDGMISCSALQIAMYALTLPPEQRGRYIEAAEYMMDIHACLEQKLVPDARMNGSSLRFWEAQYDVLFKANFMNSPHGWTAWTVYAKYYLYLLTGKVKYLREMVNTMGACVQLMDLNGNLRWAFAVDPQIQGKAMVKDVTRQIKDGYQAVLYTEQACGGKFQDSVIGEEYVEMVSNWYRMGEQCVSGGFDTCPLINQDMEYISVDSQGGCCDNDVHEIFKCMEETVLKKAYVAEQEDGNIYTCGCRYENGTIYLTEEVEMIHVNLQKDTCLNIVKHNGSKGTVNFFTGKYDEMKNIYEERSFTIGTYAICDSVS